MITEEQKIALGLRPSTVRGWLFWLWHWSPAATLTRWIGRRLRYAGSILIGRCVLCGGRRSAHRIGAWTLPHRWACGWCNKRIQHGMNYGMGAERLRGEHP